MPPKHLKRHDRPHDRRNDTGLAAPGKRISKKPSNGLLNGSASVPLAPPPLDHAAAAVAPPTAAAAAAAAARPAATPHDSAWSTARACPAASLRSSSDLCPHHDAPALATPSPDAPSPAAANPLDAIDLAASVGGQQRPRADTMDSSKWDYAGHATLEVAPKTVIRARSLRDVIATLLLLLQLPPWLLIVVQLTFALLTLGFAPGTLSSSAIFTLSAWFSNRPGEPAMGTNMVVDLFVMFFFIWLPVWAKDISLDLSQVVIAISLGGGASSQGKFSILTAVACLLIVGCRHLLRLDVARAQLTSLLASAFAHYDFIPVHLSTYVQDLFRHTPRSHHFLRVWLEVHIIVQGIFRIVRRNMQGAASVATKRTDSDILAMHNSSANAAWADPLIDGVRSPSTDGRPPGQPPAGREISAAKGGSSSKRRRKQATFVRSQQPFWAAVASTKVTVSKEFEQSEAQRDQFEAGNVSLEKIGGGGGKEVDDRGWVKQVHDTEVEFEVKLLGLKSEPADASDDDVSRILMVRVNGADWGSINLTPSSVNNGRDIVLAGKLNGLTPSTNYEIEFVRASNDKVIGEASVFTRPLASIDPITVLPTASGSQSQRPLSPTSTLKQSIATIEGKLADVKARSKKMRRDHRTHLNHLQREVAKDTEKLKSSSATDSRHKSREIQFQHTIRQAEEAASALAEEIDNMGDIPEEVSAAHQAKKREFKTARQNRAAVARDYEEAKEDGDRGIADVKHENQSVTQKREKLEAKLQKQDERKAELEKTIAEIQRQQQDAKDLQSMNRTVVQNIQRNQERQMNEQLIRLEAEASSFRYQTAAVEQTIQVMESGNYSGPSFTNNGMNQHTPESSFAAPVQPPRGAHNYSPFGPAAHQYPIGTPPVTSRRGSLVQKMRGRKSSMLSDASGFTDDAMGNGHPHHDDDFYDSLPPRRNNSDGSGSGSGSTGYEDTASPVPASRLSPIGTKAHHSSATTSKSPRNGMATL